MQIRETVDSASFEIELTTTNSRIVLEALSVTGQIELILGATETDALSISYRNRCP